MNQPLLAQAPEEPILSQGQPKTVYFDGPVDKGNVEWTMKRLSRGDTLVINSLGGDGNEAQRFAKFIQDNEINTHVNSTGQAQSAAVLLFAAGKKRTAGKNAQFHLHSGRNKDGSENFDATVWYLQQLQGRGVDMEKLQKLPMLNDTITLDSLFARSIGLVTD